MSKEFLNMTTFIIHTLAIYKKLKCLNQGIRIFALSFVIENFILLDL